jgi:uncharacterized membrane protein HdeD (DUF308 family)
MKVSKRQKINTLLSAAAAALAGSMLASGYGMDSSIFYWILGCGILLTGFVQAIQDVTAKQPLFGSSDVMIGAGKMAVGCLIMFNQTFSMQYAVQILAGMAFFHGLYLLQQAVEVRYLQKGEAGIILGAAAFSAVAGIEILLAFSEIPLGIELCLFVDAGALVVTGILLFLVKPAPQQAKKPAAAKAPVTAAPAPTAPAVSKDEAAPVLDILAEADTAPQLTLDAAPAPEEAEKTPAAVTAAPQSAAPAQEADSSYAFAKLGSFASKASKRMRTMAKDTVSGFKEGLHEGEGKR